MREFGEDGPPDLSNLGDLRPNPPPPPPSLDDTPAEADDDRPLDDRLSSLPPGYPWLRS